MAFELAVAHLRPRDARHFQFRPFSRRRLDERPFPAQAGFVKSAARVARPPARPLLIYDGDCDFCQRWLARWRRITGERLDYLPFQDASVAARFPEIPLDQFASAVHLIEPDGHVYRGAAAALRARGLNPRHRGLLWLYEHVPGFAPVTEAAYRCVARNRPRISHRTRGGRPGV